MTSRINRLRFLSYWLLTLTAFVILIWIVSKVTQPDSLARALITVILYLLLLPAWIILVVKRLHDLNRSGWEFFLLLIPLYNIYFQLLLFLKQGTIGPNVFGEDPLSKNHNNLTT